MRLRRRRARTMLAGMRPARPLGFARVAFAALLALAACGGGGSRGVQLTENVWTWVDVPGTQCSDGSHTGLAVNPAPAGPDGELLIFLNGGGACWDDFTCNTLSLATPGPFGRAEFEQGIAAGGDAGTILDRTVTGSPFGGATLVFIPYCTGDVHWGKAALPGDSWRFAGDANLVHDLAWLKGHLPAPAKLVVAGSSAGGYGSLLVHHLARSAWPSAKGYLVDDSGPPLVGDDIPAARRSDWFDAWDLADTLVPLCPGCADDLSLSVEALATSWPDDRLALLSFRQDPTIAFFAGITPVAFEDALLRLVHDRVAPYAPRRAAFLVEGSDHTTLGNPSAHVADGVSLPLWLSQMVNGDDGWTTLGR
jgi:hypothetical protein